MTAKGSKREPWEKPCSECGKPHMTACYSRSLCPECRARVRAETKKAYDHSEQGKKVRRESSRRWRERHPEQSLESGRRTKAAHREEYNAAQRERYWANVESERHRSKIRARAKRGDRAAQFEYAKITNRLKYCERMRLTALELPCGKRPECWTGKPCDKVAGQQRPRTVEW